MPAFWCIARSSELSVVWLKTYLTLQKCVLQRATTSGMVRYVPPQRRSSDPALRNAYLTP